MIDAPRRPPSCTQCGEHRAYYRRAVCWSCARAAVERDAPPPWIICGNCAQQALNRGRGLCPRCYQYLWRTGTLPWPNGTTPEEVLDDA